MLPPVNASVLSANPKIDALYRDLCTNKLNADGSSKADGKTLKERDTVAEELRKVRIEAAKRGLIVSGLHSLSYRNGTLPVELQDLVAVIAALLDGQIAEDDKELLTDELGRFKEKIGQITSALTLLLQQDASAIATLLVPEDPPESQDLPAAVKEIQNSLATTNASVAEYRLRLAHEATDLHDLQTAVIETSIRLLEQTTHGSVARGTKAKADYLALVAEGASKKLAIQQAQLMSQVQSPELREALKVKKEELDREKMGTRRKIREAEERLEECRGAGGLERVAQEYAEVLAETERVRKEIERLEGGKG